jgi:predicted DNA-binding transcriptional regulator AlpA
MTKRKMPAEGSQAVYYIEQQIDDWIRAQINGRPWVPVEPAQPVFIRRREVLRRVGFSNFKRWHLETDGRFPRGYRIGAGQPPPPDGAATDAPSDPPPRPRLTRRAAAPSSTEEAAE